MSEAERQLREHQSQLDMDGVMVGVSRQALDEVLAQLAELQTEAQEQARLLDMSATRELGFIASLSTMEADYNAERIRADALFDQLAELEHTLEKAIIWLQHDCPFTTRDEIMETLLQESSDE